MEQMLNISSNPHVRARMTTAKIMQLVAIALLPAAIVEFIISDSRHWPFWWYPPAVQCLQSGYMIISCTNQTPSETSVQLSQVF